MFADPAATPLASPLEFTVAMELSDELQVAFEVTSAVEPSLYVAVAVNCCVAPVLTLADAGVTAREASVAVEDATVTLDVPLKPFIEAVTVVVPAAAPVTSPPALTEATLVLAVTHVAFEVISAVEPSLYFAVAVNCCVPPTLMLAVAGASVMAVREGVLAAVTVT